MATRKRTRFADPLDILRALPVNIVAIHVYPYAVLIVKDRDHLIKEVDQFCRLIGIQLGRTGPYRHLRIPPYPIDGWDVEQVTDWYIQQRPQPDHREFLRRSVIMERSKRNNFRMHV
jgi:hypothetical protein